MAYEAWCVVSDGCFPPSRAPPLCSGSYDLHRAYKGATVVIRSIFVSCLICKHLSPSPSLFTLFLCSCNLYIYSIFFIICSSHFLFLDFLSSISFTSSFSHSVLLYFILFFPCFSLIFFPVLSFFFFTSMRYTDLKERATLVSTFFCMQMTTVWFVTWIPWLWFIPYTRHWIFRLIWSRLYVCEYSALSV